jgi:hypothetical protein
MCTREYKFLPRKSIESIDSYSEHVRILTIETIRLKIICKYWESDMIRKLVQSSSSIHLAYFLSREDGRRRTRGRDSGDRQDNMSRWNDMRRILEKVVRHADSSKAERLANLMNGRVMWMKLQWPSFAWRPCIPRPFYPLLSVGERERGERVRETGWERRREEGKSASPASCIAWVLRQRQVIDCTSGRTENNNSQHRLEICVITRQSPRRM